MALLHYATCLAILLRQKSQANLQGIACLAIIKSRNIFLREALHEVESGSNLS